MTFRVQRLRAAGSGAVSYTVVGVDGLPVEPVEVFLAHLTAVGRSPNTVDAYAHDLRDFLEWGTANEKRIKIGCSVRLAFGLAVAILGATVFRAA